MLEAMGVERLEREHGILKIGYRGLESDSFGCAK
jgi:hypothetical protein